MVKPKKYKKQSSKTNTKLLATESIGKEKNSRSHSLIDLIAKAGVMFLLIVGAVWFTDMKGYFNPDYTNDHTRRKWNSFYQFVNNNPVDIALVGNSHLYTGINPENLSNALGANCFILASPGTTMTDAYYCLKEAIKVKKPKIAIIETYCISDYVSHNMEDGALSEQFKSFSARKDLPLKLASTPVLFNSKNYLAAWSNTVRNHHFLFSDKEQIKKNIEIAKQKQATPPGLYLGRYIRFTSGLESDMLKKYDAGIVPFNSDEFSVGDEALKFVEKTIQLCKENDVVPIFLTLPMYYKHFSDMDLYVDKVAEALNPFNVLWENQQTPYDFEAFTPECFENTVAENQHMTYHGSLVSTYKLASFINYHLPNVLYNRSNDVSWKQLFYGSDGYFRNHKPEKDGISQILHVDEQISGLSIKEIDLVPNQGAKQLLVKIYKEETVSNPIKRLQVNLEIDMEGHRQVVPVEVNASFAYDTPAHSLYISSPLNPAIQGILVRSIDYFE